MWSGWLSESLRAFKEKLQTINPLIQESCGVTAIEYALIAALIAVAAIAAWQVIGTSLSSEFSGIANTV